ncbi:hypothetical protein AVEN_23193-1 [Araneus ventricosus]|uniref:Uncharacterized protein n=1 Tax=Araneus ventricosus TaxID=182803 RepID=A0A4Y2X113_ARAVE|nr:hypothetical protein AVEN_23193-1 [Araneus ventricosus]
MIDRANSIFIHPKFAEHLTSNLSVRVVQATTDSLRACLRSDKPHGTMAIQAGKSITSCPQLVSVPLTGLERMLSSSLNMALSLPISKSFTCLTAIIAVVVELARHFTMLRSEFSVSWHMRKSVPNFKQEGLKRIANNLLSRHKIRRIVKFMSENRDLFWPP